MSRERRRKTRALRRLARKVPSNLLSFLVMFLGSLSLVSLYDNAGPLLRSLRGRVPFPSSRIHLYAGPLLRRLHGGVSPPASGPPSAPDSGGKRELREATGCGKHVDDEDACNAGRDGRGMACHFCTDHNSERVCVAEDAKGFRFAPCNSWTCYDADDPEKSDLTTCERVSI